MRLAVGTRVRLLSLNHTLTDTGAGPLYGTTGAPTQWLDSVLVHLDRAVRYRHAGGTRQSWLWAIVEDVDNLEALPEAR